MPAPHGFSSTPAARDFPCARYKSDCRMRLGRAAPKLLAEVSEDRAWAKLPGTDDPVAREQSE